MCNTLITRVVYPGWVSLTYQGGIPREVYLSHNPGIYQGVYLSHNPGSIYREVYLSHTRVVYPRWCILLSYPGGIP